MHEVETQPLVSVIAVSEYWSLHLPTVPDRLESHSGFVRMVNDEAREDV